ncbi:hypothetical protein C5Q97_01145 [Victivallales bacterium CCUG 44730]|nr:hypothetical protein C5Q97_01145 [Victivallales bacterium CCUG 44730]
MFQNLLKSIRFLLELSKWLLVQLFYPMEFSPVQSKWGKILLQQRLVIMILQNGSAWVEEPQELSLD